MGLHHFALHKSKTRTTDIYINAHNTASEIEQEYMNSLRALKLLNCLSKKKNERKKDEKKKKQLTDQRPEWRFWIFFLFVNLFFFGVRVSFYCTIQDFVYRISQMVFPSLSSSRSAMRQRQWRRQQRQWRRRGGQFCFTEILKWSPFGAGKKLFLVYCTVAWRI